METKELLIPRYQLYATYPNCPFELGCILIQQDIGATNNPYYEAGTFGIPNKPSLYNPENYPHNFSKLTWWEYRTINDFPEYLRDRQDGEIYRMVIIIDTTPQIQLRNVEDVSVHRDFTYLTPATQTDYFTYKEKYLVDKARQADDFINQNEIRYNS